MDAKHFRIGNYVQTIFSSLEYKRIKDSTGNYPIIPIKITSMGVDCDFKPIPLTEEWLLKFGFTFNKEHGWFNGDLFEFKINDLFELDWYENAPLKHVHQLQNLYHALTGKELKIK